MKDCLFCKLATADTVIWSNDQFAAFKDIHPKAATHVLLVPKAHVDSLDDLDAAVEGGALIQAAQELARFLGIAGAYTVQINVGRAGGQEIDHLHLHLMSSKEPML